MVDIGDICKGSELGYKQEWGKYIWVACAKCGKERWVALKRGLPRHNQCNSCCHKGEGNHLWHGGIAVAKEGYKLVYLLPTDFFRSMTGKNHYVREHRLVMARHLGRCLQRWEIVHHKNGNRDDNRIENLELTSSVGEHSKTHSKGYKDGYAKGLIDGRNKQLEELKQQNRLLQWQIKELKDLINGRTPRKV